jgi:hypothetical protein
MKTQNGIKNEISIRKREPHTCPKFRICSVTESLSLASAIVLTSTAPYSLSITGKKEEKTIQIPQIKFFEFKKKTKNRETELSISTVAQSSTYLVSQMIEHVVGSNSRCASLLIAKDKINPF